MKWKVLCVVLGGVTHEVGTVNGNLGMWRRSK